MPKNEHHYQDTLFPSEAEGRDGQNAGVRPQLERHAQHRRVGPKKEKAGDSARIFVRVTRVSKRLIDWDNLCTKPVVDCCRYSGLIPDDRPGVTKIEADQRKPEDGEEEHTLVEIIIPD